MKLALAKLGAITALAHCMGLAVHAFHRTAWRQFKATAAAIWSVR